MNTSIRFASSGGNWSISRNVSTWRSGMTSRCVSAFGLMSRTATNPSVSATWSPSRYSLQKRQSSGSEDSLLRDRLRAHAHELADGSVHEPRRIVVPVAAAGSIDEDDVLGPELGAPARERRRVGGRAEPRAAFLLHGRGNGVDLDRREAQARQAGDRSRLADEPGKPVPALAIAIAPEVDSGQHHLAVALRDPPLDLAQDGLSGPAARRTAHERDDAEVAREATAVLDLHERAHAIETRIGLDAGDRADIAGDGGRGLLAAAGDHDHVLREAVERRCEIGAAARDIDAAMGSRGPRSRMPRLAHGFVGDAARVHNRDLAHALNLGVTVGEEAFAD